ncbi:MAG: caspase family protein [Cyclobacteriaceae bacterium]|nr:caspase family protein [Cyclobacteriaceae bacterium]
MCYPYPIFMTLSNTFKCVFFFALLALTPVARGQEVDLVRLGYDKSEVSADQIGLAVSKDGRFAAFCYSDKTIKIFDFSAGRFVKKFAGPYSALVDVQLTNSMKLVLVAENEVQVWDWKKEKPMATLPLAKQATKTAFSDNFGILAVGQMEGVTSIFDIEQGKFLRDMVIKKHHVSALAIHPKEKIIAVGVMSMLRDQNPLRLFDLTSGQLLTESPQSYFTMAAFTADGSELVTSGINALGTKVVIRVHDSRTLAVKRELESKTLVFNAIIPYGGFIADDRFMAITVSQSFNVYRYSSGEAIFTTKSDKVKTPAFPSLGVGTFNVFPLTPSGNRVLLNASKNNINQIYDTQTNSIVAYFFSDSSDDFAVVSRDGRTDGTAGAMGKVYWTSKNATTRTSLESTFQNGFTPQLLNQIISNKEVATSDFDVEQAVAKTPVIAVASVNDTPFAEGTPLSTTQKTTTIKVNVLQHAGEVVEMKLFQNAKLTKVLPGTGANDYSFNVSLNTSLGEENYFFVVAASRSGIDSEKKKFSIAYNGASGDKPRLFLVTIGINQYKNSKYNLNYAKADADSFESSIKSVSGSLFKEVIPFSIRNDKAVRENILAAFDQIKKNSLEQDMLVVYYAGHGVMSEATPEQPADFYIVPHDVTQLYGRTDILETRAVSAKLLKQVAESVNAQKQVFILDACQSAGALEAVTSRGAAEEKAIAQLARSTGTFWITSTGSDQFASEFEKLGHGVFTYLLLEGLKGKGDANQDKKLTIRELSTYIENNVPELSEQLKGTAQYPSAYSFGNDFPLVVYK